LRERFRALREREQFSVAETPRIHLAARNSILPATSQTEHAMPLPPNDPFIEAIAGRLRGVIARQPGHGLDQLASILGVAPDAFRQLIENRTVIIDAAFLIDVVAALVREFAVAPQWLLTGQYDSSTHRRALILGEDHSDDGRRALRDFVREHFQRLRDGLLFGRLPLTEPQE
jgi:hypothetical protein